MDCNAGYKKCFINSGEYGPYSLPNKAGIFYMKDLNDNIQNGKSIVEENVLITSRTDMKQTSESQICACHITFIVYADILNTACILFTVKQQIRERQRKISMGDKYLFIYLFIVQT